jgi:hypothetical protein
MERGPPRQIQNAFHRLCSELVTIPIPTIRCPLPAYWAIPGEPIGPCTNTFAETAWMLKVIPSAKTRESRPQACR